MTVRNTHDIVSRRGLIAGVGAAAVAVGTTAEDAAAAGPKVTFTHGVASGDPLQTAVVIWTRAVPDVPGPLTVDWEIAETETFKVIIRKGITTTDATRDYTVKVDANGLEPGQRYYFRFRSGKTTSAIGRTRTFARDGMAQAKLALMSCSNYGFGYFNAYSHCAARDDIDAVLHVGDYIYEYAPGVYSDKEMEAQGRTVEPPHEIVSLADYRQRYATYRSDPDLQEIHRRHPFIVVWDDHETANDAYKAGAENHSSSEGDWAARKRAAAQAYFEWLPIRPLDPDPATRIYRSFELGGLATLIMLDTRIYGRDRPPNYTTDLPMISQNVVVGGTAKSLPVPFDTTQSPPIPKPELIAEVSGDPKKLPAGHAFVPDFPRFKKDVLGADRTILGAEQEAWLRETLATSKARGAPWQIIGQQTIIATLVPVDPAPHMDPTRKPMVGPDLLKFVPTLEKNDLPLLLDTWGGGYQVARKRLLADLRDHANNALVLTGDIHNAWAFELKDDSGALQAVELVTSSVTSPGFEAYMGAKSDSMAAALKVKNLHLRYTEIASRGYIVLTVEPQAATAEWVFVDTVKSKSYAARIGQTMKVMAKTTDSPMLIALDS